MVAPGLLSYMFFLYCVVTRTHPTCLLNECEREKRQPKTPFLSVISSVSPLIIIEQLMCTIPCLLYTSDAADEEDSVDLGGRRIIKKKKIKKIIYEMIM